VLHVQDADEIGTPQSRSPDLPVCCFHVGYDVPAARQALIVQSGDPVPALVTRAGDPQQSGLIAGNLKFEGCTVVMAAPFVVPETATASAADPVGTGSGLRQKRQAELAIMMNDRKHSRARGGSP
jgi:hypothetical protein